MATYAQIAALRRNQDLKDKIIVAVTKAATDVISEEPTTLNHRLRVRWAEQAFRSPEVACEQMMWRVLQNAIVQDEGANTLDNDIQFVVNSLVDDFSSGF